MNKSLKDQLRQWEKNHKEQIRQGREKHRKRKSEVLTTKDIESLMGMNRTTYRRGKGGAWRNGQ
jgi:hypothetical protein